MGQGPRRSTRIEQREQTRRRLLEAALEVFARRGYHGATVAQIADAAGVTQGALYGNFAGKEALFLALVDDRMAGQAAGAVEARNADDRDRVSTELREHTAAQFQQAVDRGFVDVLLVLEVILHAVREHPDLRRSLAERHRHADAVMGEVIRGEHQAARAEGAPSPEEIALVHSALIQGLGLRMLLDPEALSPRDAARLLEQAVGCLVSTWPPEDASPSAHRQDDGGS